MHIALFKIFVSANLLYYYCDYFTCVLLLIYHNYSLVLTHHVFILVLISFQPLAYPKVLYYSVSTAAFLVQHNNGSCHFFIKNNKVDSHH